MKVIMISGKAQHGKDTTAGFLAEALQSDGSKVLITHYGDLVKYVCEKFFAWDGKKDESGRSLLQRVGTDKIRSADENYWVKFIGDILTFFDKEWEYVLVPDCRFPNEVDYLQSLGMETLHVRVVRAGFNSPLTQEQQEHLSETALDNVAPDYYITNDSSLEELRLKVTQLATDICGFHQVTMEELMRGDIH